MEEEISIKDLMAAIWRKKTIILGVTLIFFILGVVIYGKSDNKEITKIDETSGSEEELSYYMKTDFVFARGENSELDGAKTTYKLTIDTAVITNLNSFAKSKNLLENILSKINCNDDLKDIQSGIRVVTNGTSDVMALIVGAEKEEDAIKITEEILQNFQYNITKMYQINEINVIDGPTEIDKSEIADLEDKSIQNITPANGGFSTDIPQQEISPSKKIVLITGIGFVLACGIVVVIEIFSSSVKNEATLERATNLRILVKIPKTNLDVTDKFELLRVKLKENKTILVTSSEDGDGKSFVATNLAKSFARFGKKVLLTDTKNLLNDKGVAKDLKESKVKNLVINLSKGDSNEEATKLSESEIEKRLLELEQEYDIIVIDSNNVLNSANALAVSKANSVKSILISSERKTKLENIVKAKNNIEDIGGTLVGNVLNAIKK